MTNVTNVIAGFWVFELSIFCGRNLSSYISDIYILPYINAGDEHYYSQWMWIKSCTKLASFQVLCEILFIEWAINWICITSLSILGFILDNSYCSHMSSVRFRDCKRLLKEGANPNAILPDVSPLHIAAGLADSSIVRLMLEHGGNPNYR